VILKKGGHQASFNYFDLPLNNFRTNIEIGIVNQSKKQLNGIDNFE